MALSKIRDYITSSITTVNSDLRNLNTIKEEEVAETIADKSYSMTYNLTGSELGQAYVTDSVDFEVIFYFKAFRDGVNVYDTSMDLVNDIRLQILSLTNIYSQVAVDDSPIKSVTSSSITGELVDSNDKQIKITLPLEFLIYQTIC